MPWYCQLWSCCPFDCNEASLCNCVGITAMVLITMKELNMLALIVWILLSVCGKDGVS